MPPHLDHIIILIPYTSLLYPPPWLTSNFILTPGGRHADNKTENKLICFKDGSYIELISFINDDPALRDGHYWGKKPFGIIDFAFTSKEGGAEKNYEAVKARLGDVKWEKNEEEVKYQKPVEGGRKRDDGVLVKWHVTFPVVSDGYQRGELPFFCHDITDREVRVPFSEENVRHPSGVYGVKQLGVNVPGKRAKTLGKAYAAVLGEEGLEKGIFETEPLRGGNGNVGFGVREPEKEWQKEEMERRGWLLLGDLVFGKEGEENKEDNLTRIDAEGSEIGLGHWFL
jgi:hypothetical protein